MFALCITHRVDEDISWVEDIYGDLLIYNKSDKWDLPYPCSESPKILNEVDTFLRGIIEAYDHILYYRWIYLLKPNCKDYYQDVISYVSINQYNQIDENQIVPLSDKIFYFNLDEAKKNLNEDQNKVLDSVVEVMSKFGINLRCDTYACAYGSQYFFHSQFILNKPKEWWMALHYISNKMYESLGNDVSNIFEFLWPLILQHSLVSHN
jgi:hypothetical protein